MATTPPPWPQAAQQPAAQPTQPPAPRRGAAAPAQPSVHYGTRVQYTHPVRATRGRDEHWLSRWLFLALLGLAILGGLAIMGWAVFGSYQWGWHANPCKPPCVAAPAVITTHTAPARPAAPRPSPAPRPAAAKPTPAPVDLSPVERGLNRIADSISQPAAEPARVNNHRSTLEEQEAQFWQWAEGRNY